MVSILKARSTNYVFVFSKVALTKAKIGKEQAPLSTKLMHSARFVVIWPYLFPPLYAWVHISNGMWSIQKNAWT